MKLCPIVLMMLAGALSACDQPRRGTVAAMSTEAPASAAGVAASMPPMEDLPLPTVSPEAKKAYQDMEDSYVVDTGAQWALSAKASSTYGEVGDAKPISMMDSRAWKATGPVDGNTWCNNSENSGVDWLELGFERPVYTDEVRVVLHGKASVESITRLDVIEENGQYHTIWEGPSDVRQDERGNRTWFVRKFEKTPYKVTGVKLTFANRASSGYKEVDAVQLVAAR